MNAFSEVADLAIRKRFKSRRAFLLAADPHGNESSKTGYLCNVLKGRKPAPLSKLRMWADALGLYGADWHHFVVLGMLTHAPHALVSYVTDLEREVRKFGGNLPTPQLHAEAATDEEAEANRLFQEVLNAAEKTEAYSGGPDHGSGGPRAEGGKKNGVDDRDRECPHAINAPRRKTR